MKRFTKITVVALTALTNFSSHAMNPAISVSTSSESTWFEPASVESVSSGCGCSSATTTLTTTVQNNRTLRPQNSQLQEESAPQYLHDLCQKSLEDLVKQMETYDPSQKIDRKNFNDLKEHVATLFGRWYEIIDSLGIQVVPNFPQQPVNQQKEACSAFTAIAQTIVQAIRSAQTRDDIHQILLMHQWLCATVLNRAARLPEKLTTTLYNAQEKCRTTLQARDCSVDTINSTIKPAFDTVKSELAHAQRFPDEKLFAALTLLNLAASRSTPTQPNILSMDDPLQKRSTMSPEKYEQNALPMLENLTDLCSKEESIRAHTTLLNPKLKQKITNKPFIEQLDRLKTVLDGANTIQQEQKNNSTPGVRNLMSKVVVNMIPTVIQNAGFSAPKIEEHVRSLSADNEKVLGSLLDEGTQRINDLEKEIMNSLEALKTSYQKQERQIGASISSLEKEISSVLRTARKDFEQLTRKPGSQNGFVEKLLAEQVSGVVNERTNNDSTCLVRQAVEFCDPLFKQVNRIQTQIEAIPHDEGLDIIIKNMCNKLQSSVSLLESIKQTVARMLTLIRMGTIQLLLVDASPFCAQKEKTKEFLCTILSTVFDNVDRDKNTLEETCTKSRETVEKRRQQLDRNIRSAVLEKEERERQLQLQRKESPQTKKLTTVQQEITELTKKLRENKKQQINFEIQFKEIKKQQISFEKTWRYKLLAPFWWVWNKFSKNSYQNKIKAVEKRRSGLTQKFGRIKTKRATTKLLLRQNGAQYSRMVTSLKQGVLEAHNKVETERNLLTQLLALMHSKQPMANEQVQTDARESQIPCENLQSLFV